MDGGGGGGGGGGGSAVIHTGGLGRGGEEFYQMVHAVFSCIGERVCLASAFPGTGGECWSLGSGCAVQ